MNTFTKFGTLLGLLVAVAAPTLSPAQRSSRRESDRRQETKGEWQDLVNVGAAIALLGQFNKDKTASYIGAAGSLYGLHRMEQDSRSQDRIARDRARFFNQRSFDYRGCRYERVTVRRHGKTYYTFQKARNHRR